MRDIENYEHEYLDNPFEKHMLHFRHACAARSLEARQARHVLEIGCGLEPSYKYYDTFDSLTIVEPSALFCDEARRRAPRNVTLINSSFDIKLAQSLNKQFDAVLLSSLLHEVPDPLRFLESVACICSRDTFVHINVPNAFSLHRLLGVSMGIAVTRYDKSERQIRFQQQNVFDMKSLSALVNDAGFSIEDSGSIFIKPFTHEQMQALIDCGFLTGQMLEGLNRLVSDLPQNGSELYMNVRLENEVI